MIMKFRRPALLAALIAVFYFGLPASSHARLKFVDWYQDSDAIDGLDKASFAALSPDGKHVYVPGSDEDAVAVFALKIHYVSPIVDLLLLGKRKAGFRRVTVASGEHACSANTPIRIIWEDLP